MAIRFNSIGLPTGIDTEGMASAANQTASGIAAIGAGLTNLGARKDARDAAQKEKMQNSALEYFTLKATNAKSEDEILNVGKEMEAFNASNPFGAIVGGAEQIAKSKESLLIREGLEQDNRFAGTQADMGQATLDATNLTNEFNTKEADVISKAFVLSTSGDAEGFRAFVTENLPRLQATYGDNASKLMERGIIAVAQAKTDLGLIDKRSDENRDRDRAASQLETVNQFGNKDLKRADTEADRLATQAEKNRGLDKEANVLATRYVNVNSAYEDVQKRVRDGTMSPEDALYLTNAVKNIYETTDPNQTAGAGIDILGDANAFVDIQTAHRREDPGNAANSNISSREDLANREMYAKRVSEDYARNNVNIASEVGSILANAKLLQQTDPLLKTFIEAEQFNNNVVKPDGTQVKLFEAFDLQNANGIQVIPNAMRTKITNYQKEQKLEGGRIMTDGEILAILQVTIKSNTNPFLLFPGGKEYGVRELDFNSFKKKADAWRKTNTGEVAAKRVRIARQVALAENSEAKIKELELQYVLASQKGNQAEMEKLSKLRDKEIDMLTGLSSYMNNEVGDLGQSGMARLLATSPSPERDAEIQELRMEQLFGDMNTARR